MTQDQTGQAQGTDYVRGEVVPDEVVPDEETDQSGPMTRLRKVASAMRGDKPDQTVPVQTATTSSDTEDPNGSWQTRPAEPGAMYSSAPEDEMDDGQYEDATRPNDVGAVRSPEDANGNYWDDERNTRETATARSMGATVPDTGIDDPDAAEMRGQDATVADHSMTGASTYDPVDPVGTGGTVPAAGYASQADIATDPRGLTDTGLPATETGTRLPATETGTGLPATETGTAEGVPVGKHAAAADAGAAAGAGTAADAGLRPGEATDRLGDFGDIAFGNLLPDAAQYSAQWQQIQFRFVDDPQASVTEAAEVLSQVTGKLEAAIQERQRAIEERKQAIQERASALRGRWGEGSNADTETLRETLRMYRAFMNQLIGPMS
jgi:hypothetical protein